MGFEELIIADVLFDVAGGGAALEFLGGSVFSSVLSSVALNLASSVVMSAFKDTPSASSSAGFQQVASGRQQMIRSSVAERRVVYGTCKVSGPIVYGATTGTDNGTLWLVIPLAGHEVEAIDDIYFNDDVIPNGSIGGGAGEGLVTAGRYANAAYIYKHLGAAGQTYDANLGAVDSNWDSTKVGNGVAYIVVGLLWNRDIYTAGLPNISAIVRGKKLYDPRDAGTRYSANWALVLRDYLTNTDYGMGCASTEINDASFIAAANVCDERVLLPTSSPPSDALYSAFTCTDDLLTTTWGESIQTGDGVRVTGASRPVELSLGTTYYWIRADAGRGFLASSFANAFAHNALNLTDGSGDITYYNQCRYEAQGTITTGEQPMSALKALLPAAAGTIVWQQGEWYCYAGAYRASSGTLTVTDLRAGLEVMAQPSRRQLYNQVRGVFSDPVSSYQPIDFPVLSNAAYETQDGDRYPHDISLPFTVNTFRAQRIAKIYLEKSRQGIVVNFPAKPSALKYAVWDTIALTIPAMGWVAKEFIITSWVLNPDSSVDLALQEEASASYTWSSSDAIVGDPAPNTSLSNPNIMTSIAGLALSSGTNELFLAADGTIHSRIRVTWTAPTNVFISSGGYIDLQYDDTSVSPTRWQSAPFIGGGETVAYILPVEDGITYNVRIRAVSSTGAASDWVYATHLVVGKTLPPSDVTGFVAVQTGNVIVFTCDTIDDLDLDTVEIRYGDSGNTNWADASPVAYILRGQSVTNASLPPGTWEILARAKDTSGNYSTTTAHQTLVVRRDGFTLITSQEYHPNWAGTLVNMVEHWTGVLTPQSQSLASALGWEVFDEFVPNAYTDCYYTGGTIDKTLDAYGRVYADIVSVLGPGETSGTANPAFEIDYRLSTGAFDGFETWSVGNANFRYVMPRIHVDTTIGKPVISAMTVYIDAMERTESGTVAVGVGGGPTARSFTLPFHVTPSLQLTGIGTGDITGAFKDLTTTGFTCYRNDAGIGTAGSVAYTAIGV